MARTLVYREGGVEVEITGDLLDLVDEAMSGAQREVMEAFEAEMDAIEAQAKFQWPVRSGTSRDSFLVVTRLTPDTVETVLKNTAPYAYKVRFSRYTKAELQAAGKTPSQVKFLRAKFGEGAPSDDLTAKHVFGTLVRRPAREAERRLAEQLRRQLQDLAGRL